MQACDGLREHYLQLIYDSAVTLSPIQEIEVPQIFTLLVIAVIHEQPHEPIHR